ncbi:MAG TPA: GDP-L-fucose synthase [Trueperaceae bacterium]
MSELVPGPRIYVAGHRGLVGSAIVRKLREKGHTRLITRSSAELDLRDRRAVDSFFERERPELVFLAAARVGGIVANQRNPADFIYDNLAIATNVIDASFRYGVRKLLNLGSSCIYPKHASQPIDEDQLLSGALEATNRAYAIAKIAAIEMCDSYRRQHGCDFVSAMPTNLYGPNDNFDLETSHVLPALLRKMHEARERGSSSVEVWGSGEPRREFLHVDDLADACLFLMANVSREGPINVGVGKDISIRELAELIREIVGFDGELVFDRSKPDGTPRKLLDVSLLSSLGWRAQIGLREGIRGTYDWFLEHRLDAVA